MDSNFVTTGPLGRRYYQHTWTYVGVDVPEPWSPRQPLSGPDSSPLISRRLDSDTGISAAAVRQDANLLTQFAEPDKRESRTGQLSQTKGNSHRF